jgi:hypothetical protein
VSQASGQPSESDPTLTSGDSMIEKVAAMGRLVPGRTFANRYVLISQIGMGATGIVHAAHDPERDRKVAIKLLRPNLGDAIARAAKKTATLSHPNLLAVHEIGTVHDVMFVVMDHVDGGTLRAWIDAGPYPWPLTLELFRKIATGLAAAHRAGLVHGNFNPMQVLLTAELEPRIGDFGCADELADVHADQLAFCQAFFEALHGERPISSRIHQPPPHSKVPAWLQRVVVRGLDRDPTRRWPSMDALLEALDRGQAARRRRVIAAALAIAILLAITAVILNHR